MPQSGTKMVSASVGTPKTNIPAHATSLDEILDLAGKNQTDLICLSFGPLSSAMSNKVVYAALVAAQDASGELLATWTSEPMFDSSEAAVEHAQHVIGVEIWPLLCGGSF